MYVLKQILIADEGCSIFSFVDVLQMVKNTRNVGRVKINILDNYNLKLAALDTIILLSNIKFFFKIISMMMLSLL